MFRASQDHFYLPLAGNIDRKVNSIKVEKLLMETVFEIIVFLVSCVMIVGGPHRSLMTMLALGGTLQWICLLVHLRRAAL